MKHRVAAVGGYRLLDQGYSRLVVAFLTRQDAQHMKRLGVIGIPVEDLPVSGFGIVEAPLLMMGDGIPEQGAIIVGKGDRLRHHSPPDIQYQGLA